MERPKKLEFRNCVGAGKQIHADFAVQFNCIEFTKKKGFQMIDTEPWIQFASKEWDDMIETVFKEMVELWNDKYAIK